jgi:hypothetical protein
MAQAGSRVAARAREILAEPAQGLTASLAQLAQLEGAHAPPIPPEALRMENVAPDIAEKGTARYPAVHIYCEKLLNELREKFRTFSGKARMVAEARLSQDRIEGLEQRTQQMVDAITGVLDASRGDWGQGMHYSGGYEVAFGPVKHGGKNYLQITKVTFEVDISTN